MKSNNSNTAVVWENELQALKNALTSFNLKGYEVWPNHNGFRSKTTFLLRDEEGNSITGSWNYDRLNHFILGYGKAFEKANNPQPKESTHITWWKGLNEEEQTKLCQKHFQGIPVESLMERSIKVMYHYENPETTTNTVTGEGFTGGKWKVDEHEQGRYYGNITSELGIGERGFMNIRTIAILLKNNGEEEAKANANRIVNCVNNHNALVSALRDTLEVIKNNCDWTKFNRQEEESTEAAKQVLNNIK